jgi:hypothetical protein
MLKNLHSQMALSTGNLKSYHISLFYNTLSLPAGGEFALGDKVL